MDLNSYQEKIRAYVDYPEEIGPFTLIMNLQEDVGILAAKLNNVLINNKGAFTEEEATKSSISIGDILYDICQIASELKMPMNDIITLNIMKHDIKKKRELEEKEKAKNDV